MNHAPAAVILLPLAAAVVGSLVAIRRADAVRWTALAGAGAGAAAVFALARVVASDGAVVYAVGGWPAPVGILLVADELTVVFLVIVAVGHLAFVLHGFSRESALRPTAWVLTELLAAALAGMAVAGDLFNLFVFVELASIASVGLIAHKQRGDGAAAGFVYLVFASISGSLFLIVVVLVYRATGVLTMAEIALRAHSIPRGAYLTAVGLLVVSFGIKFALVPLHFWQAPAYHAAGSSVAALLSGTGMKVYLYAFIRLTLHMLRVPLHLPSFATVLLVLGSLNVLTGHLLGLAERDLKRLLGFSSVAHVGYILMGLAAAVSAVSGALSRAAAAAVLLHVVFHALMKSGLFYAGRRLAARAGSSVVSRLGGVARSEPTAFASFALCALAAVGAPPLVGFYSKWRVASAVYGGWGVVPVFVIAVGTVVSMLYYARVFHAALRPACGDHPAGAADAPPGRGALGGWSMAAVLVAVLGLSTVGFGVAAPMVESVFSGAAAALVDLNRYVDLVRGGP